MYSHNPIVEITVTCMHCDTGSELALVDIMFAPFLERMAASLPYYKGFVVRTDRFPCLLRWYQV